LTRGDARLARAPTDLEYKFPDHDAAFNRHIDAETLLGMLQRLKTWSSCRVLVEARCGASPAVASAMA